MYLQRFSRGFTLVEFVVTMVLLGILMVAVAPRFFDRGDFANYAVRDQIISAYRFAQQRAMYDHSGNCYRLFIDGTQFGPQRDTGAGFGFLGPVAAVQFANDYANVSADAATIAFDGLSCFVAFRAEITRTTSPCRSV